YLSLFGLHLLYLVAVFTRRQIQSQSFYVHRVDMHGRVKKSQDAHTKLELSNADNRLNSRLVIVQVGVAKDSEPLARNLEPLGQRDVKGIQLNFTLESGRQGLNHRHAQDWLGARDRDGRCGEHDN